MTTRTFDPADALARDRLMRVLPAYPVILRDPVGSRRRARDKASLGILALLTAAILLLAVATAAMILSPPVPSAFEFLGP